jgi:hypothetical protein
VRDGALNSPRFAQTITAPITAMDSSSTTTATIHPDRDLSLFLGLSRVSLGVSLMVPISRLGADRSAKATDPAPRARVGHQTRRIGSGSCSQGGASLLSVRIVFKHGRQRDVQGLADVKKAPGANAVFPAFVFLNLLERHAQCFCKACLAYVEREPPLAHSGADISVDGICAFG